MPGNLTPRCWRGFVIRAIAESNTILVQLHPINYFLFPMSYFGVISLKIHFWSYRPGHGLQIRASGESAVGVPPNPALQYVLCYQ